MTVGVARVGRLVGGGWVGVVKQKTIPVCENIKANLLAQLYQRPVVFVVEKINNRVGQYLFEDS